MKDIILSIPTPYLVAIIMITTTVIIMAVKAGYLKVHLKGFDIERPSKGNEPTKYTPPLTSNRVALHKMVNFTEDFIEWGKQEIANRIRDMYPDKEVDYLIVALVCEKIYDRCLTWIILNHITDTDEYKHDKIAECYRTIIVALGPHRPDRVKDPAYQAMMKGMATEFVNEFVRRIVAFKKEEGIEK